MTLHTIDRTPFDAAEIVAAYQACGSVHKAAKALGINHTTVHKHVKRSGVPMKGRMFNPAEIETVRKYYETTPTSDFDLTALAKQLGRRKPSICRLAGQLGLTNPSREASDRKRVKMAEVTTARWKSRPHPRGALGMVQSQKCRDAVSASSKKRWATWKAFGTGLMSEEMRQRYSDLGVARMAAAKPTSSSYSRCKGGRRADLGDIYWRSAWEANYARYLNWLKARGDITAWEYEPKTFWFEQIRRGCRSYKPDFLVTERGYQYFVEVKGWLDPKSKTKLARMKKYYPAIDLRLVDERSYRDIARKLGRIIPGWE